MHWYTDCYSQCVSNTSDTGWGESSAECESWWQLACPGLWVWEVSIQGSVLWVDTVGPSGSYPPRQANWDKHLVAGFLVDAVVLNLDSFVVTVGVVAVVVVVAGVGVEYVDVVVDENGFGVDVVECGWYLDLKLSFGLCIGHLVDSVADDSGG